MNTIRESHSLELPGATERGKRFVCSKWCAYEAFARRNRRK